MPHFTCKSLAVYGVAIILVLVLFKSVIVFGENHLQAPVKISDRYRLLLAKNLPNCQQSPELILNIQQSGIYVKASLWSAKTNTHKNSLTGVFKNQQLHLSGKIDSYLLCPTTLTPTPAVHSASIRMRLRDKNQFTGQLTINNVSPNLKFTAIPQ